MKVLKVSMLALFITGCTMTNNPSVTPSPTASPSAAASDLPSWLNEKISAFEKSSVQNPPAKVIQYEYKGKTVYYIPAACCDQYNPLYDAEGNIICHPDGGLTGKGDGKCNDFGQEKKNEKLIWEDNRMG